MLERGKEFARICRYGFWSWVPKMKVQSFLAKEISDPQRAQWRALQLENPVFAGPCFHPLLFKVVGSFFPGVEIAIIESETGTGFLPFQRNASQPIAQPIPLCDYQGIVGPSGSSWDVSEILRGLDLVAWDFEHLVREGLAKGPTHEAPARYSRRVILKSTHEAFIDELRAQGKSQKNLATKRRLLERDIGPLRFESDCRDPAALAEIFKWKSSRFGEMDESGKRVIETILSTNELGLRGILSTLYAGDKIVATHFGMLADGIFFYWFPAFNPDTYRYTTGALLLQDLISHLSDHKAHTLDFGPGGESYKDYFSNFTLNLATGSYERPSKLIYLRQSKRNLYRAVRENALAYRFAKGLAVAARTIKGKK